jgi:TldD protein
MIVKVSRNASDVFTFFELIATVIRPQKNKGGKMPRRSYQWLLPALVLVGCPNKTVKQPDTGPKSVPVVKEDAKKGRPAAPLPLVMRSAQGASVAESVVLKALSDELARSMKGFASQSPAPYYIGYEVTEVQSVHLSGYRGTIESVDENNSRYLDVDLRVGDYTLDNTHPVRSNNFMDRFLAFIPRLEPVPIDDDADAIRAAVWTVTEKRYKEAAKKFEFVQSNKAVKVEQSDQSGDFSKEKAATYITATKTLSFERAAWEDKLRKLSLRFVGHDDILNSHVELRVNVVNKYIVTSEGTRLQFSTAHARLSIIASSRAADGMNFNRFEAFDSEAIGGIPADNVIEEAIDNVIRDLEGLRVAPLAEPYTGPAILAGRATGVFFHEIFGHRMEGHRQQNEEEGQTFTKKINESVMPSFISVFDDPNIAQFGKIDLNGHYPYDDEGVVGQKANLVENGILKSFLLSRDPIDRFPNSNGHGRRESGRSVVARMANLIVQSSEVVTYEELRQLLIAEAKLQGKSYGLLFTDIQGGFTNTSRFGPQAFKVLPVLVYRVYVDGRPDELVRGVDLVGTPLASLGEILATSDRYGVFNGYCGAESGFVPVSAVGPDILVKKLETEKQAKGSERLPLLPAPKPGGAK